MDWSVTPRTSGESANYKTRSNINRFTGKEELLLLDRKRRHGAGIKRANYKKLRLRLQKKLNFDLNRMLLFKSEIKMNLHEILTKLNSVALVRTRTIPTERPPPVGEVSANFCG